MSAASARASLDSLSKIIRKIPKQCFTKDPVKAYGFLVRDIALTAALTYGILALHSWLLAPLLSLVLGCVLTGLFVIGHDAGHGSFSNSSRVNRFVGHLTSIPVLWPYDVWRLSHDHHHRWTHHAEKEIAWRPLTLDEYVAMAPWKRAVYRFSRTNGFFLASALYQAFYVIDAKNGVFFAPEDAAKLKFSLRLTLAYSLVYLGAVAWAGGLYGLVFLFLIPQLVYQFWLSTFTLLHHTSPENKLLSSAVWSPERAQLTMSVQIHFPAWVDWLTHDISWHVPHHVSVGIPHYRLRQAHRALRYAYPDYVQEHRLTWDYVKAVIDECHLMTSVRPGDQDWVTMLEAEVYPSLATANRT